MKTMSVDDTLYRAFKEAADRDCRTVQELVNEALVSWLADAAMDRADHAEIEHARQEAAEQDGVEFEAFFDSLVDGRV